MKKIREEDHSISQPQPLEVVTDGDLEEVKKDPHEKENYNDAGGNPQKKKPDEIKDEKWFKEYADNVDFDKVKISDLWKKWLKKKVEDTKSIEGAPCLTCPVEGDCSTGDAEEGDKKYSPKTCEMLDDWITLDRKKKAYEWKIWLAKSAVSDKKGFFDRIRDRVRGDKRVEHPEFTPQHSDTAGPTSKLPKVQTDKYKPVDPDISLGGPQMRFNQGTPEEGGGRYDIKEGDEWVKIQDQEKENKRTGTVPKGRGGKGTPTKPRAAGDTGTGKMPSDPGKPAKPKGKPRTALRPKPTAVTPKKEHINPDDTAFSIEAESDRIENPLGKSWLNKKKPKLEKIHDSTNWVNIPNKEGKNLMVNTDEIEAILNRKVRKPQDEHLIDPKWKSWLTIRKWDEDFHGGQSHPDDGSMPFYDHDMDDDPELKGWSPLYNYHTPDAEKRRNQKKRREALDAEKEKPKKKKKSFFQRMVVKKEKKWHCDLCNMELPNDELAEQRKQRHSDFHVDESLGTGKRQRNWTFGTTRYTKKDQHDAPEGDVMPDIKDTMPKPKPRETPRDSPFERAQPKQEKTKKPTKEKAPKFNLEDWKLQNQGKVRAIDQRVVNERRHYDDDGGAIDIPRTRFSGPKTTKERLDRWEESKRKIKLQYLKERREGRTAFKKRQNERLMDENEEYEAHVSDSNKADYVERVGEAMKSNMFFFGGKVNRKTGKKAKLKPRTITLDEFTEKQNIIYHNKILPLISAIGSIGRVAMGAMSGDQKEMGEGGKDIGQVEEQTEGEKKQ